MRRRKLKKQKKIIIVSSLCLLLCLCVGYAAFSTTLSLRAKGNIKEMTAAAKLRKLCNTESGDGLYADEYENEKCIYKGTNPNNYITFNNEEWRILSIESDGTIKIILNKGLGSRTWDNLMANDWTSSTLNTYLNGNYLTSIIENSDKIVSHNWNIGAVTADNNNLFEQITKESEKIWEGKVGLVSASEYLRANTNKEQCETFSLNNSNNTVCSTTNWILNILDSSSFWLLSSDANSGEFVFYVGAGGNIASDLSDAYSQVFPVIYLTSDIKISGNGTQDDPYTINE